MPGQPRGERRLGEIGRQAIVARLGLRDPALAASARRCLAIALERAAPELGLAVADLAELVATGRSPGDLAAERIADVGAVAYLEEVAHA